MTNPYADINPITLIYTTLWDILEDGESFNDLVNTNNRIRFDRINRKPDKPEMITADMPQVRIIPLGTDLHLQRTSNSSTLKKRFAIQIKTGEQSLIEVFDIEFAIYRAMSDWENKFLGLTWNNKPLTILCKPVSTINIMDKNNITGWNSIWTGEIEIKFQTTDLID